MAERRRPERVLWRRNRWVCVICATEHVVKAKPAMCKICGQRPFRDVSSLELSEKDVEGEACGE